MTVGGLECRDRLEALQRIFEHELLHLAEFLAWGRSSCRADNFHRLSRRIFAHEGAFHDLITPRETGPGSLRHPDRRPRQFRYRRQAARRPRQSDHPARHGSGRRPARCALRRRQAIPHVLRAAAALAEGIASGVTSGRHSCRPANCADSNRPHAIKISPRCASQMCRRMTESIVSSHLERSGCPRRGSCCIGLGIPEAPRESRGRIKK